MQIDIYNFELQRKTLHLYSLAAPFIYLFLSKPVAIILLFILEVLILYIDTTRHYDSRIRKFIDKFFSKLMRTHEQSGTFGLSGSTFIIVVFFFTALFFSKGLAISSWFILIISDCLAALIGIKVGTRLENGKAIEGFIAFLASVIFISMIVYFFIGYKTSFIVIIVSSILATISELYSNKLSINDNLSIPLFYCLFTTIFNFILGL